MQQMVKKNVRNFVQKLKPKKLVYPFPKQEFSTEKGEYGIHGWENSSFLKSDFGITSKLSNYTVVLATYTSKFSKPGDVDCRTAYVPNAQFCREVLPQGPNETLLFLGN